MEDEPLTVSKESIRTYLQRIYYYKYDEEEYNKILSNFPETRPYGGRHINSRRIGKGL